MAGSVEMHTSSTNRPRKVRNQESAVLMAAARSGMAIIQILRSDYPRRVPSASQLRFHAIREHLDESGVGVDGLGGGELGSRFLGFVFAFDA